MTIQDKLTLGFLAIAAIFLLLTVKEMVGWWWDRRTYERTGRKRWIK